MIIEEIKNIKSTKEKLKEFGFVVGIVFGLLGGLLWWRGKEHHFYFLLVSFFLLGFALFLPGFLKPLHKLWMTAAIILGFIMTRIILCILFYLILTPIGLLGRIMGRDVLDLKFNKNGKSSYWIPKDKVPFNRSNYERQF